VALAASLALARGILGPLKDLRQAAQQVGQGKVPSLPLQALPELRTVFETLQAAGVQLAESQAERERLVNAAQAVRQQAEDANRTKDEFLAMLGHELRNPLAPITTALRLMALRQPEALQNERRVLERQVAHMTRLVDDLLDVSRFARGKVQLRREPLDLREVVQRAVEMVQPLLDRRSAPLRLELPPQPAWVAGDAVRLAQVVSNLLTNAAKFTPPEGRIAVRLRLRDPEVELTVEDSGAGIAPELLPRVFELFVQGRQSPDRQVGGLGLGLGIVRTLVALHGGSVRAASEGEGRGSRFTVTLPRALPGQVSSTISAPVPLQAPNARRVLLVDDNHDALDMLAQLLRSEGHEVQVAGHAAQALALLEHWTPDVALLDLGLPGMDGFELARRLRASPRWRLLPLVAVTGYGHEADRERALAAGFDEHLVKPVDAQALAKVIERLVSAEKA
jgi:signal transduction histidine kinase/CheY-like chemotaxis protein